MTGALDPFDFRLAEALGMTLEELRDRMSNREFHQWRAFYSFRTQELERRSR